MSNTEHVYMHACKHTHTRARTHTHTHTHTQVDKHSRKQKGHMDLLRINIKLPYEA